MMNELATEDWSQQYSQTLDLIILFNSQMNLLHLLASGASLLNFNFQSVASPSVEPTARLLERPSGFKKVNSIGSFEPLSKPQDSLAASQVNQFKQLLEDQRNNLINRYIQLNLQFLKGKTSNSESNNTLPNSSNLNDEPEEKEGCDSNEKHSNSKKKIKKLVKCGHDDKTHYAKGLCNNCYHKYGRTKKPWNCSHEKLYAAGMCQNCYINMYNKKKRDQLQSFDEKTQNLLNCKEKNIQFNQESNNQKPNFQEKSSQFN